MGAGTLVSPHQSIQFISSIGLELKLGSGTKNVPITENDRYSISGHGFETSDVALQAAEAVRHSLLLYSARTRCGLDLGQNSLRGLHISEYGKSLIAKELGAQTILEDHLGITVYLQKPQPTFIRMSMTGIASRTADALIADVASTAGAMRFATLKAETAAAIYALSHFVLIAPARFLLLFIALEALFDPEARSAQVCKHIDRLMKLTCEAELSPEEKDSIRSNLSFLRKESIATTGRKLAATALGSQKYDDKSPDEFFVKIYKIRNDLVHRGLIDSKALHALIGEVDRFVADIVLSRCSG